MQLRTLAKFAVGRLKLGVPGHIIIATDNSLLDKLKFFDFRGGELYIAFFIDKSTYGIPKAPPSNLYT